MNALLPALLCFALYILAYRTYGRFLGRRVFRLSDQHPTPAHQLRDGLDFVPSKPSVLFGHHFTSIAGTGPIVGPAIGVIWGWLPAMLWVVLGPILIGAVHDLGSLVVSVRSDGKSIAEVLGQAVSPRVRRLFFLIIFFELWIVIAIFALIIAVLFSLYPQAVLAVWLQIPIAVWLGWQVRKHHGKGLARLSLAGTILMYATILIGAYLPVSLPRLAGLSPVTLWMIALFAYAAVASVLPVDRLLQPRDYLNSHQLLLAMGLLLAGLIFSRPEMVAPPFRPSPPGAPPLLPFLFVIIACGAVSGFHSVVSSGTSSKQLARESDALMVGYGAMLLEGGLAVLVIIACTAGLGLGSVNGDGQLLTGLAAYTSHYVSWATANGLGAKLGAFVEGASNLLAGLAIPRPVASAIMSVFIVSFAATTLDTATRIQRYVIAELATTGKARRAANRLPATLLAVGSAMGLAFYSGDGKGAMALWPIFGAVNQLLASLALLAITAYLVRRRRAAWVSGAPMLFMTVVTLWAMTANILSLWQQHNLFLLTVSVLILSFQLWMLTESWLLLRKPARRPAAAEPAALGRLPE